MCCKNDHTHAEHAINALTYPMKDEGEYCKCLGVSNLTGEWLGDAESDTRENGNCCGAANGDDGYCDRCRTHCIPKTETAHEYLLPGGIIPPGHEAPLSGIDVMRQHMAATE